MNRRSFVTSLLGAPAVAKTTPTIDWTHQSAAFHAQFRTLAEYDRFVELMIQSLRSAPPLNLQKFQVLR